MSDNNTFPTTTSPHGIQNETYSSNRNGIGFSGIGLSLNPRSCITCRRRKVKCDKGNPCSHCVRANIECVFPGPRRAPRRSKKTPDGDLLDRVRRLESVVSSLNAQVEEHEKGTADHEKGHQQSMSEVECSFRESQHNTSVPVDHHVEGLENRFGRLVVEKGRSRYINDSFWANLNNEVEDIKAILIDPSDDEEDAQSPVTPDVSQNSGFIFGYGSTNVDMQILHPPDQQARQLWEVYKENVDPLVKVLHIPTFETTFQQAISKLTRISKTLEPLFFAIYYGAVTSTTPEECLGRWGEERTAMLDRYRFGIEQGLARTNFLYCENIVVLQAFVIYLVLLRRNGDARKIWTLTGLVVRIAQTLGIHRDGSHFGLQPFEIEMRRRLWWQVSILDARSANDNGCDPTISDGFFDTKMPLNVNDSDLHPGMTETPAERQGFTDMTFSRLLFEISGIFRRIVYTAPGSNKSTESFADLTISEKERWISEIHQAMEKKYLQNCDLSIPLCWVTATISRLVLTKMWLVAYHPYQRHNGGATLPQETRDKLFITSVENIEYSMILESEARTMKWGWLFRTYVQWHPVAFLLSELCTRTKGETVDRAWRALEASADRWWMPPNNSTLDRRADVGRLWRPLRKLLAKARAAREKELTFERASMALHNGQPTYYSHGFNNVDIPPLGADQMKPATLDEMLQLAALKKDESPILSDSSWPNSPSAADPNLFVPANAIANHANASPGGQQQQQQPRTVSNGSQAQGNDLRQHLLSNFEFESVLADAISGMDTQENPIPHFPDGSTSTIPSATTQQDPLGISAQSPGQSFPAPTENSLTSLVSPPNPVFTNTRFANPSLDSSSIPSTTPTLDYLGQQTGSPPLDDSGAAETGSMDWAQWGDMVTQYGVEGQTVNPVKPGGGPGHPGMLHWF